MIRFLVPGLVRLYVGGGGGDGGAAEQEAQRQAQITAATNQINQIFNNANLPQEYADQANAVTQLNADEVNRQYADAEKANRFGLARNGLIGGSEDVDSNAELQRRTNQGLIQAAGLGDQAAADLQTKDENSRENLISMAQSGIDTGQAGQLALQQLNANSADAASAKSGATIGNLFGDLSQAYLQGQALAGTNSGISPYANYFQPGVSNSTRTSYQGS